MKSFLVTGSSGYLGHYIVEYLIASGARCYILLRNKLSPFMTHENIIPVYTLDTIDLDFNGSSIDAVLHIGSPSAQDCSDFMVHQCLQQATELVSFISNHNIPKLIFFSTIHVYGDNPQLILKEDAHPYPDSNYGLLKLNLENFFSIASAKHSFNFTALRLSNIIAPPYAQFSNWHLVFHDFLYSCFSRRSIIINSNPLLSRDFVVIDFLLSYLGKILASPPENHFVINLTSGKSLTLMDLACTIRDRYCLMSQLPISSIDIICATKSVKLPVRRYDNSQLNGLYGATPNNIKKQIDMSFRYLSSMGS